MQFEFRPLYSTETYLTLGIYGMERGREKGTKAVIRNGEHRTYFA